MTLLLLVATAGISVAEAAPVKAAGKVELSGVVEVPLYAGLDGTDPFVYVEVAAGEHKLFMRLATGTRSVSLTTSAASTLGLKPSGKEGEQKVKVAALSLGGATFSNVTARISDGLSSGGLPVDGELSLSAFDNLGFLISRSSGYLKLALGTDGAGLVADLGTAAPYIRASKGKKRKIAGIAMEFQPVQIALPVKWSGVAVESSLAIEEQGVSLAREVEGTDAYSLTDAQNTRVILPPAPTLRGGEAAEEWREVTIEGVSTWVRVSRPGAGLAHAYAVNGKIGVELLSGLDLAVDPVSRTLSVRASPGSKLADYRPTFEAAVRASMEAKPAEDGTPPDEAAKKAARNAGLAALADLLSVQGRFEEAIAARKELSVAEPDDCTTWTALGEALLLGDRAGEAVEPLTRATTLYQPWAALPHSEREQLAKAKDKADKAEKDWIGLRPQDHACHVAPGRSALAQVRAGNPAAVATIYPAQVDLDGTLPLAAGNAALLQGQFEAAQAAYLQALKLSGSLDERARIGLYLALAPRDFADARKQLERLHLRFADHTDPLLVRLYLEGVRQAEGPEAVRAALDTLLSSQPNEPLFLAHRSRERAAAGDASGAATDWEAAQTAFQGALARSPGDAAAWASWASALAGAGKAAEAKVAAETAVKLSPGHGMAWLATADSADAAGESAQASEARLKAGRVWAEHPAYALLLAR